MKLIKINTDHYGIVDDSEIKEGDWIFNEYQRQIDKFSIGRGVGLCKKITHSTEPLEAPVAINGFENYAFISLSEVKELIGEVDVEKKAEKLTSHLTFPEERREGIIIGYNQALEDNKDKLFTVDDIKKAFEEGVDSEFMTLHMETYEQREHYRKTRLNTFIKSLPPKTEWEVEFDENSKLKLV